MSIKKCKFCDRIFESTHGRKYCSEKCSREAMNLRARNANQRKSKIKKEPVARPLTCDTKFLVCLYKKRGDSISSIAEVLDRPKSQIRRILKDAKANGYYERVKSFSKRFQK